MRKEGLDDAAAALAEVEEVHGGDGDGEEEDAEEDIHGHHDTHTSSRVHCHRDDKVKEEAEDEAPCSRTFARRFRLHVEKAEEAPCSWEGREDAQNVLDTATLSLKQRLYESENEAVSFSWRDVWFFSCFLN